MAESIGSEPSILHYSAGSMCLFRCFFVHNEPGSSSSVRTKAELVLTPFLKISEFPPDQDEYTVSPRLEVGGEAALAVTAYKLSGATIRGDACGMRGVGGFSMPSAGFAKQAQGLLL